MDCQLHLPLVYQGILLDVGYRIDMSVERLVVVEVKSLASFAPIHRAQVLTYLKLGGYPIGLLLNFNVPTLKSGIARIVDAPLVRAEASSTSRLRYVSVPSVPPFVNPVPSATSVNTRSR